MRSHVSRMHSDCTFTSLHYFLVMEVVKYIMKFENSRSSNRKDCDTTELKLSDEEQQILYYVCGHIVYSMIKKYTKMKD